MNLNKFGELFSVKGFIASIFTVTTCWMFTQQIVIPPELMIINTVVIIDFFRSQENKSNVAALTAPGAPTPQPAPLSAAALPAPYAASLDGPK